MFIPISITKLPYIFEISCQNPRLKHYDPKLMKTHGSAKDICLPCVNALWNCILMRDINRGISVTPTLTLTIKFGRNMDLPSQHTNSRLALDKKKSRVSLLCVSIYDECKFSHNKKRQARRADCVGGLAQSRCSNFDAEMKVK
jgi:hypothetical protein